MDDLLTVKDAAFECGVSADTMRRWIDEGKVESVRVYPSQRVRVPADEVDRVKAPNRKEGQT